jgi:hypothetical protein
MEFETIVVERPEPRIARIVMNRPEARNAQNLQMTYDLNAAFDCGPGPRTTLALIFRRSEIGAASPSPTPTAASRASRKSICRSHGAGAILQNRRSRKCTASVSPAG